MYNIISQKEIKNITGYYKKTYNIKIDDLYIGNGCFNSGYDEKLFYIQISITQVKSLTGDLTNRSQRHNINIKELVIFTLLHELKHAIDYQNNTEIFLAELNATNKGRYDDDREYHHSRPFELRADKFARQELNKWV